MDPKQHELIGFDLTAIDIEYDEQKVTNRSRTHAMIVRKLSPNPSQPCYCVKLGEYIDLERETENLFVRVEFLKLNATAAIGVESTDEN